MDKTTGTILLKGTFANKERRLWPGQFVNVVLTLTTQPNAIIVPSQAIQTGQEGQYVFVIKPDLTVELRPVVVNRTLNNESIIEKGLQDGEKVVTDGQLQLVPGAKVEVKSGPAQFREGLMNIAEFFIRRPVMTTLVMLAILFFGIMGYRLLPVSDLPNVDFPTILVTVNLPGASPETMASSVATPLERQFSTIAGLDSMTSTNALGKTLITLQFNLSRNIDAAAQDVQAMITKASTQLPPDLPTPPSYQKVNPADQPVLYLSLSSPTLPLSVVNEYADTFIAPRISMISGVAQVLIYGSQKFAVRIQLDPQALATRGIGIDEASSAVQKGNVNLPTGHFMGDPSGGHRSGQWSIDGGRSLPAPDCGLPERLPRAPPGDWESDRQCRE